MSYKLLDSLFYLGLAVLAIGTLFRIQHWMAGFMLQYIGFLAEALFFLLVVLEILLSRKANVQTKATYAAVYILLPVLGYFYCPTILLIFVILSAGGAYLRKVRHRFLYMRQRKD